MGIAIQSTPVFTLILGDKLLAHRTIEYPIFILFSLFSLHYAFQALLTGDTFRLFFVLIPALVLSLVPLLVEYKMKIELIPGTKTLVALAHLLHVAGGINRFYWLYSPFFRQTDLRHLPTRTPSRIIQSLLNS